MREPSARGWNRTRVAVRLRRHVDRMPLRNRGAVPPRVGLLAVVGTLVVALAIVANAAAVSSTEQSLIYAINGVRVARGLAPVRLDPTLEKMAITHTQDMLRGDYFAHGAFAARARSAGANEPVLGENLAWSWGSDENVATIVRLWLASPEHRRNLLRPGFRRIGIGAAHGTFLGHPDAMVVTADFAGR